MTTECSDKKPCKRSDCPDCQHDRYRKQLEMRREIEKEYEQQLQQARREGWEQAKREAVALADKLTYEFTNDSSFNRGYLRASTECMAQIAAMDYKEPENGN